MPFSFRRLEIPDVVLVEPTVSEDERGFFVEIYRQRPFAEFGVEEQFVQDNLSRSTQGVLRGLHYQKHKRAQGKLVTVVRGEIFDVAVDIRRKSKTYGRWLGLHLSDENRRALYVPPGFAHGFCVLSETADVLYKVTRQYAPELEAGVAWNDPQIGVDWPVRNPLLSNRDRSLPPLLEADNDF